MNFEYFLIIFLTALFSFSLGFFLRKVIFLRKKNKVESDFDKILKEARERAAEILRKADLEISEKRKKIDEREGRIMEKDTLLMKEREFLNEENKKIKKELEKIEMEKKRLIKEFERIGGIKREEVYDKLKKEIEKEMNNDLSFFMEKIEKENKIKMEEKAKEILALAIQKYSKKINNNLVTSVVEIPSDDIKAKIIGKEGRNIKVFEKETGVQLLVDQQPGAIIVSSFNPLRREVAGRVLTKLMEKGVINPAIIEELVKEENENLIEIMKERGKMALREVGLSDFPEELMTILGRLYFRSSYGQNVLEHSIEMAHLAGVMAEELGANVYIAKAGAIFHDIGKALDFEVQGNHIEIGRKILKKYGVNEEIIKAMQSHHNDYPNENLESYIVDAADAISGSRPGARSDNAEMYIKKLEGLERITKEFEGVYDAYALSAGREVRVFVKPDEVDDYNAKKMAREIALRIEEELKYPGEIKIALIREKKVVEYAR